MTSQDSRVGHDAIWLAARAAPAAWVFVYEVQSALGDIDAAFADDDWETCVEACAAVLRAVIYTEMVLDGYQGRCPDGVLALHVALDPGRNSARLRDLPLSVGASRADADLAMGVVKQAAGELEAQLPITIPVIRTAKGFFPAVRMGADLEKLRATLGLPPIDWMAWSV